MKYIINAIILILFAIYGLFAQTSTKNQYGRNDPKAEKILKDVNNKYKSFETIRAVFTISIKYPEDDIAEEQTGTLYLKGNKYKLELGEQTVICNNINIWTYLKQANEVQINNYEPEEGSINPTNLFTLYEKGFLSKLSEEKIINSKTVQVIDLTPYDKSKAYFKIRLTIDKNNKTMISTKIFDKNGNRYTYQIKKFASDLNLPDTFFTFDPAKYTGIEIIDLR